MDGLSTPVYLVRRQGHQYWGHCDEQQWQANLYTRTFMDDPNIGKGWRMSQSSEAGIPFLNTASRFRDGSLANNLVTDFNGVGNFNENVSAIQLVCSRSRHHSLQKRPAYTRSTTQADPLTDRQLADKRATRHAAIPTIGKFMANMAEQVSVPASLIFACLARFIAQMRTALASRSPMGLGAAAREQVPITIAGHILWPPPLSTGRIDPPWVAAEGWQGFIGQNNFVEFGKTPYVPGENGGIFTGHVIYASTRPFDDPQMLVQTQWEPLVPQRHDQSLPRKEGPQSITPHANADAGGYDDDQQLG